MKPTKLPRWLADELYLLTLCDGGHGRMLPEPPWRPKRSILLDVFATAKLGIRIPEFRVPGLVDMPVDREIVLEVVQPKGRALYGELPQVDGVALPLYLDTCWLYPRDTDTDWAFWGVRMGGDGLRVPFDVDAVRQDIPHRFRAWKFKTLERYADFVSAEHDEVSYMEAVYYIRAMFAHDDRKRAEESAKI